MCLGYQERRSPLAGPISGVLALTMAVFMGCDRRRPTTDSEMDASQHKATASGAPAAPGTSIHPDTAAPVADGTMDSSTRERSRPQTPTSSPARPRTSRLAAEGSPPTQANVEGRPATAIPTHTPEPPRPRLEAPSTSLSVKSVARSADQRFEQCRAKLRAAHKSLVLHDLGWNAAREPRVVVGPSFASLSPEGKQAFADTVNCFFVAGVSGQYIRFDILDWRTGNAVGHYASGKVETK